MLLKNFNSIFLVFNILCMTHSLLNSALSGNPEIDRNLIANCLRNERGNTRNTIRRLQLFVKKYPIYTNDLQSFCQNLSLHQYIGYYTPQYLPVFYKARSKSIQPLATSLIPQPNPIPKFLNDQTSNITTKTCKKTLLACAFTCNHYF